MEDLQNIYGNVHLMFKYRKLTSQPNYDKFINSYKINLYYIETVSNNVVVFCHSDFTSKLAEFRNLLNYINESKINLNDFTNIIFISNGTFTNTITKQMVQVFKDLIYENPKYKNRVTVKHTIEILNHSYFVAEIPKGPYSSEHTILSQEEIDVLLKDAMCKKNNLPKIMSSDPAVVWIGGRNGDVVKIISVSDVVGESVTYRLVV